jgi:hypothetical protein
MVRNELASCEYCSPADFGQKSCKVRAALIQRLETSNEQLIIDTLAQWNPGANRMKVHREH